MSLLMGFSLHASFTYQIVCWERFLRPLNDFVDLDHVPRCICTSCILKSHLQVDFIGVLVHCQLAIMHDSLVATDDDDSTILTRRRLRSFNETPDIGSARVTMRHMFSDIKACSLTTSISKLHHLTRWMQQLLTCPWLARPVASS
jgi:hypothetical protein